MNEFRFICALLKLDERVLKILSVTGRHTLHTISEEIFPLIELHGTQKKCGVNDSKTKT